MADDSFDDTLSEDLIDGSLIVAVKTPTYCGEAIRGVGAFFEIAYGNDGDP